jgi:hypothetical protein
MSTLKVNTITNVAGTSVPDPILDLVPNPISLTSGLTTLLSGVTWSSGTNNTTQLLGSISGTTSKTRIVRISFVYTHQGEVDHGYLSGWVFQTNKTYSTGTFIFNSHYDWYYNRFQTELLIPWDPNGTQSVSMYVGDAYNSNGANYYDIYYTGRINQ